jgi:polar amino acid transport system substrate-binding protein
MNRNNAGAIGAAVFACALALVPMGAMATDARIADLAQAGKIRVALFLPQHAKDSTTGQLRGIGTGAVAIDIARALATRMDVAIELVGYPTPPAVIECLKNASCDLAFMGIEPSRLGEVDFSPAVVQFDYTYLVPADSTIHSAADADRPGIRVAVVNKHASTLALSRVIKHAELIGADVPDAAFELLRTGKAHAFASAREPLEDYATKLPGSRVLTDAYGVNPVGIAIQQGHPGRLTYISEFVEEAKASGLVQRAIDGAGLAHFRVAPSARTN